MIKKTLLALFLVALSLPAVAAEKTATFAVANMTCAVCPLTVKKAMTAIDGVVSATVSNETKAAVVVYDDAKASVAAIAQASTDAGYPAIIKK